MQLLAFLICDEIKKHDTGHIDLLNAGGWKFPAPPPQAAGYQFQILIRFRPDPIEKDEHIVKLHYKDSDGQDVDSPLERTVRIRPLAINQYIIDMKAIVPGPGLYSLDLFLDDDFVASHPLEFV